MSDVRYKVTAVLGYPELQESRDPRWSDADHMRDKYGLHHLSIQTILDAWLAYSDSMAAGWLIDDKESIESVFKVQLEEIDETF